MIKLLVTFQNRAHQEGEMTQALYAHMNNKKIN
jgi:hypothetical protein